MGLGRDSFSTPTLLTAAAASEVDMAKVSTLVVSV